MKVILALMSGLCVLVLSVASQADSRVVYPVDPDGLQRTVIKGHIYFPGFGTVDSIYVCVTSDKQTLKAEVPAGREKICVDSYVDHSDSTHPETRCRKYEVVDQPARTLETPVTTSQSGCVRSHIDRSDSTHPQTVCDQMGIVQVSQSLNYQVLTYGANDYRHFNNPKVENRTIQNCQ